MADYLPKFKPGQAITRSMTGTVVGGKLVTAAGVHAVAGSADWLGVASRDAVSGDRITVYQEGVQRLVANAAITIGVLVKADAAGTVIPWVSGTDNPALIVGLALEAAAGAASELDVKLSR